jgi:hypothetical protein
VSSALSRAPALSVCGVSLSPWNGLGTRQAIEEEGRTQQRWHAEAEARRGDEVRELRLRSEAQLAAMRSQLAQLEVSFPRPPSSLPWPPRRLGVAACAASFVLLASPLPLLCVCGRFVYLACLSVCLACLCICVLTCARVCVASGKQVSTRALQ